MTVPASVDDAFLLSGRAEPDLAAAGAAAGALLTALGVDLGGVLGRTRADGQGARSC